jgi:hypothetical protein
VHIASLCLQHGCLGGFMVTCTPQCITNLMQSTPRSTGGQAAYLPGGCKQPTAYAVYCTVRAAGANTFAMHQKAEDIQAAEAKVVRALPQKVTWHVVTQLSGVAGTLGFCPYCPPAWLPGGLTGGPAELGMLQPALAHAIIILQQTCQLPANQQKAVLVVSVNHHRTIMFCTSGNLSCSTVCSICQAARFYPAIPHNCHHQANIVCYTSISLPTSTPAQRKQRLPTAHHRSDQAQPLRPAQSQATLQGPA